MTSPKPLTVNGWTLFVHPLLRDQLEALLGQVAALRESGPTTYVNKNAAKQLAALVKLIFEVIPQNPERPEYRSNSTLGKGRRNWFGAKFFQQYRLYFRYHRESRIIVYVWLNDEDPERVDGSADDAYREIRYLFEDSRLADKGLLVKARGRIDKKCSQTNWGGKSLAALPTLLLKSCDFLPLLFEEDKCTFSPCCAIKAKLNLSPSYLHSKRM
jgi:toxin YhaV